MTLSYSYLYFYIIYCLYSCFFSVQANLPLNTFHISVSNTSEIGLHSLFRRLVTPFVWIKVNRVGWTERWSYQHHQRQRDCGEALHHGHIMLSLPQTTFTLLILCSNNGRLLRHWHWSQPNSCGCSMLINYSMLSTLMSNANARETVWRTFSHRRPWNFFSFVN